MTLSGPDPAVGDVLNNERFHHLYVHLPFCRHKCGYCDFNAYAGLDGLMQPYVEALERELGCAAERHSFGPLATVYFGGGTPSLLPAAAIGGLLDRIRSLFEVDAGAEITLEANPASTDLAKLETWRQAGVNRLSIGVQGFDPRALAVLERRTDGAQARRAVGQAREAGFTNLSLDLIYAVPFQTLAAWEHTLSQALDLNPEHLSCYCLTIEPGTLLHRRLTRGQLPPVDVDVAWQFLERCRSVLIGAGYRRYEVSSWSRPGFESRHNRSYWQCRPVYGAGCGAHSYARSGESARRWWNWSRPQEYISSTSFVEDGEDLDPRKARAEQIMLGLRTVDGLEPPHGFETELADLEEAGLIARLANRVHPTERGLDLHNQIALAVL
ncbi:MAG: radical SAM family heme chaperone HemW [Chloroflexi bacterium]|nr:MAG: radical SAM family heme chaperone HemW [Chloroflexota bacterium]